MKSVYPVLQESNGQSKIATSLVKTAQDDDMAKKKKSTDRDNCVKVKGQTKLTYPMKLCLFVYRKLLIFVITSRAPHSYITSSLQPR